MMTNQLLAFHKMLSTRAELIEHRIGTEQEARAVIGELLAQQAAAAVPIERHVLQFMQFIVAAIRMHRHHRDAELTAIGNWIGWSFAPIVDDNHQVRVELNRMDLFTKHPLFASWPPLQFYLVMYLAAFYYYVRSRTAMKNIAEAFWENAELVFDQVLSRPDQMQQLDATVGTSMLEWASKEAHERAKAFTPVIEKAADNKTIPDDVRFLFAVSLSTNGGRFSSKTKEIWAVEALSEHAKNLPIHLEVQLRAILANPSTVHSVEQLFSVVEQSQSRQARQSDPVKFARNCGRTFDALAPYLLLLIDTNDLAGLVNLLWAWYRPSEDKKDCLRYAGLLVTVPSLETGLRFLTEVGSTRVERDSQPLIEKLVALENQFLGTAKTVAYSDNSKLELPSRPGIPEINTIEGLENVLVDYYCPIKPDFSGVDSQLMFPAEAHPVQAVQLTAWGKTWPISASLSNPQPDAVLQRAVIWAGAATLTEEMEAHAVGALLRRGGVEVEIVTAQEAGVDDFLKLYNRNDIELLWVISHGHFDHWVPHAVRLQVSHSGAMAELETLWSHRQKGESRRLLVLNVCDGGRFEELGPVPRVGLAAGLADSTQATISHLWPVMPFPSAAFGACLAMGLAKRLAFFDAYVEAMTQLKHGPQEISKVLDEACGEQIELSRALMNRTEDFNSLQIWGSAVFYQ